MKTIPFELQYYYRRWLFALPVLIANVLLAVLTGNYLQGALYYIGTAVIMIGSLYIYYRFIERKGLFLTKGSLTLGGGTVKISAYGREYGITDVTELLGSTLRVYQQRCAMLSADTPAGRIKLFSEPLAAESGFSDSSLFPVWQALLESFPALTPVQKAGQTAVLWYRKA